MEKNIKQLLDAYKDYDDRILANNILDYVLHCEKYLEYKRSDFLDPRQQILIEQLLRKFNEIDYFFDGGYEEAERKICIIYNSEIKSESIEKSYTIFKLTWNNKSSGKISHRDVLGSLMGSGIKREMVGDIKLVDNSAYVVCIKDIFKYLSGNIDKIGSTAIDLTVVDEIQNNISKVKVLNTTVSSLRLDGIVSAGFGVSRSDSTQAVKSGKIKLNWQEEQSATRIVKAGDTISYKGKGRIVLKEVLGQTNKERTKIIIDKYI